MDYGLTATVIGAFTLIIALSLLYLSTKARRGEVALFAVGLFFVALTVLNLPVIIVDTIEYGAEPPCEWVINDTVDATQTSNYTFSYTNSCNGRSPPATITTIFTIYTWLIWTTLFAGFIAAIIYFIRSWVKQV